MFSIINRILHPSPKIPSFLKHKSLLPEQTPDQTGKPTLVLDLNQTLVDSSSEILNSDHDFVLHAHLHDSDPKVTLFMWKRPGLHQFLQSMAEIYEIVVFTASGRIYGNAVLDVIDPCGFISHRLFKDSCLKRVIFVDDNPRSYALNRENGLSVSRFRFENKSRDRELLRLVPFLRISARSSDLRTRVKMWNNLAAIHSSACKAL